MKTRDKPVPVWMWFPFWARFCWLRRRVFYPLPTVFKTTDWGDDVIAVYFWKWGVHVGWRAYFCKSNGSAA